MGLPYGSQAVCRECRRAVAHGLRGSSELSLGLLRLLRIERQEKLRKTRRPEPAARRIGCKQNSTQRSGRSSPSHVARQSGSSWGLAIVPSSELRRFPFDAAVFNRCATCRDRIILLKSFCLGPQSAPGNEQRREFNFIANQDTDAQDSLELGLYHCRSVSFVETRSISRASCITLIRHADARRPALYDLETR